MNHIRWTPLFLLFLGGAASPPDPEALLREGDGAAARGDYQSAAALYTRALERTTDPAPAAFNLAAAQRHLALEAPPEERLKHLRDAELLFGSFTASSNPRRARALYGLGLCQLQRAEAGDQPAARAAVTCFRDCLADPQGEGTLTEDARHNLARARLLAWQLAPPPQQGDNPQEPPGDNSRDPPRPQDRNNSKDDQSEGNGQDKRGGDDTAVPEAGDGRETSARNPHGRSGPPTIPDRNEPTPLSAAEAASCLDRARRALRADREQQRRLQAASPSPFNVRDW
jgi:tetratricopeptide (TPR) repeat protein